MKITFVPIVLLLLFSCSKEKKYNRDLSGQWEILELKITEATGIGEFVEYEGQVSFTQDKKSHTGSYNFNLNCNYQNMNFTIIDQGTYSLSNQDVILKSANGLETEADILYVNKVDLEFSIPNWNNKNIYFIMKKIE